MARIRLGNLKGPKGDRGEAGPRGPQGIQGPPGTAENIDLTPFVKKTEGATLTGQYTFTNNTPIKLNGYDVVSENNRVLFKNASNQNVFAFDTNTITHNDKSLLTQDKANTLYAPVGDYALRTALNAYATKDELTGYASKQFVNYGLKSYLTKTDADTTYAKKTDVGNSLTLTQANDAYVSKAGDNNVTGTINISQTAGLTLANHILESNPTNLVIKNKANQPILTVYPSVAYLNGREVLNQFKADQLYAPKTALNNYVTTTNADNAYVKKDQYNNDMNSLLTALKNVNN
ncbi:collagen-like protein [Veillonella sp.]|uniref:collagen-like triple helix repeat-containing protein n=1 Tax=Veillonella sp. TaxID=1926307 RepID=UPI00257A1A96|nr:collagen-like protein [Veillonella sp.]MBS6121504.1 collagen-like protein [Veillonella sp.]